MTERSHRDPLDTLTRDYRTVLLRFLPGRDEQARADGYELGRRAFASGVSLLDVCRVHHLLEAEVLDDTPADAWRPVLGRASELLLEVLAAYDMTHRGVLDA